MNRLCAVVIVLVVSCAGSAAQAQVIAAWYPAPAVVVPPPVVVAPPVPVPVVGYYAAPVVRYTPGYYYGAAPLAPLPRRYTYRERFRSPYYRGTLRVRGW